MRMICVERVVLQRYRSPHVIGDLIPYRKDCERPHAVVGQGRERE